MILCWIIFLFRLSVTAQSPLHDDATSADNTEELVTIAKHLHDHPWLLADVDPEDLRAIVSNPRSLKILPKEVLHSLLSDPIFNVQMPVEALREITKLIERLKDEIKETRNHKNIDDSVSYNDYEYEYYNYVDDVQSGIASFFSNLDPKFIKKVPSDLIVSYFESASPSDIKEILGNSTLLSSIPPDTIADVVNKVPDEILIALANSDAVKELFTKTTSNLTDKELENIQRYQKALSSQLISKINADVLEVLPDYLLRTQLTNIDALKAILNHPDKLKSLLTHHPHLPSEIPSKVIVEVISTLPHNVSLDGQVLRLLSEKTLREIFLSRPGILKSLSENDLETVLSSPSVESVLIQLPVQDLVNTITSISTNTIVKTAIHHPSILKKLPQHIIDEIFERPDFFHTIAGNNAPGQALLHLLDNRPDILQLISGKAAARLARKKPKLIRQIPLRVLETLAQRKDMFSDLTEDDIATLVRQRPKLVSLVPSLPTPSLTKLLDDYPRLVEKLPNKSKPYLAKLLRNRKFITRIPPRTFANLASFLGDYVDKYTVIRLLTLHPNLLSMMKSTDIKPFLTYLDDSWFRERLPCSAVVVVAQDLELLKNLPSKQLIQTLSSSKILSCLPVELLERVMADAELASRVPISTMLWVATRRKLSPSLFHSFMSRLVVG